MNNPIIITIIIIVSFIKVVFDAIRKIKKNKLKKTWLIVDIIASLCFIIGLILIIYMVYNPINKTDVSQVLNRISLQDITKLLLVTSPAFWTLASYRGKRNLE